MNIKLGGVKDRDQIPKDTVLLFESDAGWNAAGGPEIAVLRHLRWHVVLVDGSFQHVELKDFGQLRWDPSTNSPAEPAK